MTNGDFVSEIRNHLKALNKDDHISSRYILSVAAPFVSYIINNRPLSKVFRDGGIFTTVECIPLERLKSQDCCIAEFRLCSQIMRTKKKMSKILNGKSGSIVSYITNMTNGEEYEQLRSIVDYNNSKKRQFGNLFKYYFIGADDYLYLLNSTNELVNISAIFLDEDEALKMSVCAEKDDEDFCKSKLDNKFIAPDEYISTITQQVLNVILGGNKKITEDTNPDGDPNQKTRTN